MKHINKFNVYFHYKQDGRLIVNEEPLTKGQVDGFHQLTLTYPEVFEKNFRLILKDGALNTIFKVKVDDLPKKVVKDVISILLKETKEDGWTSIPGWWD